MNITVEPIPYEQRDVFIRVMELFSYDFSEFSGADIDDRGFFGYPYIDAYWTEKGRYPFFIRADGRLAGLVLVRSCCEYTDLSSPHSIAEFFVMKKYRHKGVGRTAAVKIFDMFPGGWEVARWTVNKPAGEFWSKVIGEYTGGDYDIISLPEKGREVYTFYNSKPE